MKQFKKVSYNVFINNLEFAQAVNDNVRKATTPVQEIERDLTTDYYLAYDGFVNNGMGFAIDDTGELTSVFSINKGNGAAIMKSAIDNGAQHLDCFDGYLTTFYKKYGFLEVDRQENWTAGQPDVVYMRKLTPAEYLFGLIDKDFDYSIK